ncbi:MAG: urea ABC transporter ATP-binding protein UrtD [Methylococcales symbiont of Hymedesmia sp. n. MRB-2018]|nr:MAG: urea ABC transporter ATP-binding protein UrtD [Methylococcales symbiont of Hymedesmia sp. n. MRB-2018]KAF3982834.1 MAG: urea ABC transporter ATP-binding protein UrtD [Methylococcales symbiont of Hymedesmia sp. n. MRB-2018]
MSNTKPFLNRYQTYDFVNRNPVIKNKVDVSHGTVLYMEGVSISFDGFKALNDLSLYINDGELRCLIGPNGAGKTTLMDVITGKTKPDAGSVYFGQTIDLLQMDESEIARAGICRKFQKPSVFEKLSVFENLELSMQSNRGTWVALFASLNSEQRDRIDEVLEIIGMTALRFQSAGILSHGQKQWLEIGMLLMQKPRVMLVDEPVAGMTNQEIDRTAELLLSLEGKHSVIVVEHDMEFIRSIAKKVTVLHEGSVLTEGTMDEVQNDPRVIQVYLGE